MVRVERLSLGSMFIKQKMHAFTQVRIPSKTTPSKSAPHSSPGNRSMTAVATVPSRGSKTSISASTSSVSHNQTIISVSGWPLTLSTRMPGSRPISYAGESEATESTSAPSEEGSLDRAYGATVPAYEGTVGPVTMGLSIRAPKGGLCRRAQHRYGHRESMRQR